MSCDIFIFAGEASGDLHGEKLISALYAKNPSLRISGVAGPRMRSQEVESVLPMEQFQVMGFIDVLKALPKLIRQFYAVRKAILQKNPRAIITIDSPAFSLRLARSLKKAGFVGKIIHYICPSVWAHGRGRIAFLEKYFDGLLTILPFEKEYFAHTKLPVVYVGNPLTERIVPSVAQENLIALFPGSREKEIERNFPIYLRVVKRAVQQRPKLSFVVSLAQEKLRPLLEEHMRKEGVSLSIEPDGQKLRQTASFAIAKSGTITLELALAHVPTIVTYGISPLDLFIAKHILRLRLPYYCLVNIIAAKEVFPELIGPALTEHALYEKLEQLLQDPAKVESCKDECQKVRRLLGDHVASAQAAEFVYSALIF